MGTRRSNGAIVFASETCALDLIDAEYEREVNPGEVEVLVVDKDGFQSHCLIPHPETKQCIFEHVYFTSPSSVVVFVADSGVVAALGYAAKAGVPFHQGLIRCVKFKLLPVKAVLERKRVVVVVNDSTVRGTTSSKIVRLVKEAGVKEVQTRIASPPMIAPCYYGVDAPRSEESVSNRMDVETD